MQEKSYYFPGKGNCFQGLMTIKVAFSAANIHGFLPSKGPRGPQIAGKVSCLQQHWMGFRAIQTSLIHLKHSKSGN